MPIRQLRSKGSSFQTRSLDSRPPAGQFNRTPLSRSSFGDGRPPQEFPRYNKPKKKRLGRLFRTALPLLIILIFLVGILTVGAFAWYSRDLPDPNKIIERDLAQSTKIYDRTGEKLLYEIHGTERRTSIELTDIPQYAIDATIAVEDKNFFKHQGISLWGILRGQIVPRLQGKRAQGGSTLTQQFVKNAILTNERKLSRKIKEWILSYQLEQKYTKEEILKLYFNEIPYGSTAYGIEAASGIYFGKSASDLNLAEAAVLAALPQAPSYYSPYGSNKEELIDRQHVVLNLMVDQGYITETQAEAAKNEELSFKARREDINAPHFVFMVQQELAERYGDRLVEQGGLTIITTLDWDKQQLAEETIDELLPGLSERYDANNAALVTIDVESGDVLTLVGSADYFNDEIDGQVNVATSLQQPGSSLKPFAYAQAFSMGYRPETILYDLETNFSASGEEYKPRNYSLTEHGPVTMRQALAGSLNIPAVKTLYLAGVKNVTELASKFGYTTLNEPDRYGLSLVLGGADVKLIEHTNAYAAFARDGVAKQYSTILKVTDKEGSILEEKGEPKEHRVLDRQIVRQITSILTDNNARAFAFGENNYLTLGGRPVAAKTGTTNELQDTWLMGYTPQLVSGVWVGNNYNASMKPGAAGATVAGPIWNAYMRKILAAYPSQSFPAPEPLGPCDKPMLCGFQTEEIKLRINKVTGQRATPFTPPSDIEERTFREIHNILHYVDTSDPTGSQPENPSQDPQYNLWEEAVLKWAEDQGYLDELPPEEDDQLHSPENQPSIIWLEPSAGATISQSEFTLRIQAEAKRGIKKIDYYLDNQYLGTSQTAPFNLQVEAKPNWQNGSYTLKATAYDDVNNSKTVNITVNLDIPKIDLNINATWLAPIQSENYTLNSFPSQLEVNISPIKDIKKVDFYYSYDNIGYFIGAHEELTDNVLRQDWTPSQGTGLYKFYLIITDVLGRVSATDEILINIKS